MILVGEPEKGNVHSGPIEPFWRNIQEDPSVSKKTVVGWGKALGVGFGTHSILVPIPCVMDSPFHTK